MRPSREFGGLLAAAGLALAIVAAGCAAPEAGKATSPVEARFRIDSMTFPAGAAGPVTVTISQTVTITPTSSASQTAETKVDATATIPAGALPK